MHHAIKGLAIGMGGGLLVWAILLGGCHLAERPPTLVPLRVGMTMAEFAEARPGEYKAFPVFRECPSAFELTRAESKAFLGTVAFRLPDGTGEEIPFAGGACQGSYYGPKRPAKFARLIPQGIPLWTALRRLPPATEARIVDGRERWRPIEDQLARLRDFNGKLTGGRSYGIFGTSTVSWEVEFRNGCVTKVRQWQYED